MTSTVKDLEMLRWRQSRFDGQDLWALSRRGDGHISSAWPLGWECQGPGLRKREGSSFRTGCAMHATVAWVVSGGERAGMFMLIP